MFWADKLADDIIKSGRHKLYHVDDMKTPSGKIHVGSLVGVMLHDFVYKSLLNKSQEAVYTYVFNDMDPMDGLPYYLDEKVYKQEMGKPLFQIPAPDGKSESLASQYAHEFIEAMYKLGATPEILWSHELYQSGKMNEIIKEALDNVEGIAEVYKEVGGYNKPKDWYPFQVICEKCGKVGTTQVYDWDGQQVSYRCVSDLVTWAKGCEYEGKISPFNGTGKLMWKVDWPAHWKAIGVTIEGAGKDHCSAGGSRDMAKVILEKVFDYPNPYDIPYEWLLLKGKKMSSSKGVGTSASEFVELFPPEIGRFLFARNHYNKQTNFTPEGMTIPDLFDEYDRCVQSYFQQGVEDDFGRMYEVAQIRSQKQEAGGKKEENESWKKPKFLPRFFDVAKVLQDPKLEVKSFFKEKKGSELTDQEQEILNERVTYAKLWLAEYAPDDFVVQVKKELPEEIATLSSEQKYLLAKVVVYLEETKELQDDEVQNYIYQAGKGMGLKPKDAFQAVYISLLGKMHGPKAGALIVSLEKSFVIERFTKISQ